MISAVRANLPWRLNKTTVFVKHNLLSSWWRPGIVHLKGEGGDWTCLPLQCVCVCVCVSVCVCDTKFVSSVSWKSSRSGFLCCLLPLSARQRQVTFSSTGCYFSGTFIQFVKRPTRTTVLSHWQLCVKQKLKMQTIVATWLQRHHR